MIPAIVQWEITDRCNYHCPHCYHLSNDGSKLCVAELADESAWKVAKTIVDNKLFFVTFTGGEPLLRKVLLVQLVEYLNQHNVIVSLNTNLSLLNDRLVSELKINRMLVSCPASDPAIYKTTTGNGNYSLFESKIRLLSESKVNFMVNMVVSKLNHGYIRKTALRMVELGIKNFAATPVSINSINPNFQILLDLKEVQQLVEDLIWAHEELGMEVDIMEAIPKCIMPKKAFELELPFVYRSCRAGERNGAISTKGEVRPCSHNPLTFGNVLEESMEQIWKRMANWRKKSENTHQDCLGCDMFNYCGSGCRVDADIRTNQPGSKHPYMMEEITEAVLTPKKINLKPEMMIRPSRIFLSRPEADGWLVATGSSRSIITVNSQLYDFFIAARNLPPINLVEFARKFNTTVEDKEFNRVISLLVSKKFFVLSNS